MNYHHIYHAGNFADILKHITLCFCLEKMHEKPTPFFALDTHAGIAKYNLADEKSVKTFEAQAGIKKLLFDKNFTQILPSRYLKILAKINACEISQLPEKLRFYTGSPAIIKDYLRANDKAIFAELNREDFVQLKKTFAGSDKFSILHQDGFHLLKSKLPPLEKRALILIDPAFEKDQKKISQDYQKIILSLQNAAKRFRNGIYLIWYPIIDVDSEMIKNFEEEILKLNFDEILKVKLDIGKNLNSKIDAIADFETSSKAESKAEDKSENKSENKMHACAMMIINPPWQIDEKIKSSLSKILPIIQNNNSAKFDLRYLKNNTKSKHAFATRVL